MIIIIIIIIMAMAIASVTLCWALAWCAVLGKRVSLSRALVAYYLFVCLQVCLCFSAGLAALVGEGGQMSMRNLAYISPRGHWRPLLCGDNDDDAVAAAESSAEMIYRQIASAEGIPEDELVLVCNGRVVNPRSSSNEEMAEALQACGVVRVMLRVAGGGGDGKKGGGRMAGWLAGRQAGRWRYTEIFSDCTMHLYFHPPSLKSAFIFAWLSITVLMSMRS